jgi:hypothetical protein
VTRTLAIFSFVLATLAVSAPASAHCDTTKGPVVTAARAALDAGDPTLVYHWVRAEDEPAVKAAFDHTMAVRRLGPDAKALADRYFFETVVRIHRAGEGAPYTGLSDDDPEPIIAATDRALQRGSTDELEGMLVTAVKSGLAERFAAARAASTFKPGDVAAGRQFVAAYVPLTHWVEGVYTVASEPGEHHAAATAGHADTASAHERATRQYLPWIVAGLLAIAAAAEGALLLRRRHATTVT